MAWLSDWKNRIKLKIDHTKIDDTLTDFPVMLNLNNYNAEALFDELWVDSIDDAFTGTNGSILNSSSWYRYDGLVTSNIEIQSNKARVTYTSAEYNSDFLEKSYYKLTGDFDIQIDIDVLTVKA